MNKKVKCQCLNCNHIQWVPELDIEDCENCGWAINAKEQKMD
jgi:Zn finger protein HypA/HybF involved in hydrogenase expression